MDWISVKDILFPARVICYISTTNLFIAILGFIKTENYWYMPPMLVCLVASIVYSIIEFRRHKNVIRMNDELDKS